MTEPARPVDLWDARAPTAADIDQLARAVYAAETLGDVKSYRDMFRE